MSNNNVPLRIAITGLGGRMANFLIKAVVKSPQVTLGAALCRLDSRLLGIDAGQFVGIGPLAVLISDNLQAVENDFDIMIDFTRPEASLVYLDFCRSKHKGLVIGTTGFNKEQQALIAAAANDIGIVCSANFSVGVNLMLKLLEKTAQVMGENADIEIIEAHHRYKVDAPSGTALAMGETIARIIGLDFSQSAVYSRKGNTGERQAKSIGFATVRAGDIVGEHTAMFADIGERLEIIHKASSRMTFAIGAVRAAIWLARQQTGLYNMTNVLNLDVL